MGKYEDLERLQKLKESGILTEEEFNTEKQKILNGEGNTEKTEVASTNNMNSSNNNLEIKGDFPLAESKIPLELLDGEKVIVQHKGVMCSGAINDGYITLTNKRILFNKSTGKNFLRAGLIGVAIGANRKNEEISFSQIASIEPAKYVQGSAGMKIVTNDGYTHKYVLQSLNIASKEPNETRDKIIELIKNVIDAN